MKDFEFLIAGPYENYEELVIEIYFKKVLIAEINQEYGQFEIVLVSTEENLHLPIEDFCEAIEKAKKHLVGDENVDE
jgi:hypothetical protein